MEGSDPTRFGSIVHDVCEAFHEVQMSGRGELPAPIDLFEEIWAEHKLADFEYFLLGRTEIEAFLDRTLYERNGDTIATELPFLYDVKTGRIWVHEAATRDQAIKVAAEGGVRSCRRSIGSIRSTIRL
jgi:hypothetical protein